jgi:hypothetical protein
MVGHVTLNNTRIFLLAIQGVLVECGPEICRNNLLKIEGSHRIGRINEEGDILIT